MTTGAGASADDSRVFEQVFAAGTSLRVGGFRFWFAEERWEWSDEVARMHGHRPGAVHPTTELLLAHKHPDDREHVASIIERSREHGEPFSSRHRIVDTGGAVHEVIVVGDTMTDEQDRVVGTAGYYIDVTDTLAENRQEVLDETLPELYAARAVIEQAKGALMLIYGIGADQAFRVLTWRSQETNTKLRALAAQLLAELPVLAEDAATLRTKFDHLLLTVHERVQRN
ncbi:PAS and ANTAR domain-containing protein [Nocardia sp. CDC160]|uniref:PAS and ANTAR domain-containing protein n=1 Tax=Nocardia sp. CDC160 TaxID=3112166 RepID=UPI003FA39947